MLDRLRIGGLSGSYKVRSAAELARDRKVRTVPAVVYFLDDTQHTFHLDKRAKGQDLLDQVFDHLELSERDYFGLQFSPTKELPRWLDSAKSFRKQWDSAREGESAAAAANGPPALLFRVKFFVTDPAKLLEEYTRYQFFLQVKRDVYHGRLPASVNTACLLASYVVQSELGDYNPAEHGTDYLRALQLVSDQNEEAERRICELHKLHRGQLPADAEFNFLDHAKRLEWYGVDFHRASDQSGKELALGVSSNGLLVYHNQLRINSFSWAKMVKVSFKRKDFCIQLRREKLESYDAVVIFHMASHKHAKVLWKACVEHHSFFRLQRPQRATRRLPLTLGSKFHYSGRTELQALEESKRRARVGKTFVRSPSRRQISPSPPNGTEKPSSILRHDNKVTSKSSSAPRKAWGEPHSDDEGGFIPRDSPPAYNGENAVNAQLDEALVTVRLKADEQGRFGFNVKGGVDLKMPVLVSRVAPHTPADRASPRIAEGDQVLMINGRDVNALPHDQVVALIRGSRDHRGELVLVIRPGVQLAASPAGGEEPLYQYVPETDASLAAAGDAFTTSLLLLSDGLASGALVSQYEQMYRKNPDLAVTEARRPENTTKNRYRDISPYDATRVVLVGGDAGDYINANYVNMEVPSGVVNRYIATQGPLPGTVTDFWRMVQQESSYLVVMLTTVLERGRTKCQQYWPAPADGEMQLATGFTLRCVREERDPTGSFIFRDLLLCDAATGEQRTVQQMQYLVWPDHGVPADPALFIQFTERVRAARAATLLHEIEDTLRSVRLKSVDENGVDIGERRESDDSPNEFSAATSVHQAISAANPPIIVHCSAGIGRTGVLILMDTALSLMERREPVYPLDIVRTMRDQRACMIQNASQYRFVCECIFTAYQRMFAKENSSSTMTAG